MWAGLETDERTGAVLDSNGRGNTNTKRRRCSRAATAARRQSRPTCASDACGSVMPLRSSRALAHWLPAAGHSKL